MPEWLNGKLSDLIAHHTGGGTPARNVETYWNGSIPWASVKDFCAGQKTLTNTQESITPQGLQASASNLIPANIVLMCSRMAVGRVAITTQSTAINQDVKALFPAEGVGADYLYYLLTHSENHFASIAVGSTVKGISTNQILGKAVSFPSSVATRNRIAQILDTLDTAIHETEAIIAKLQSVKQGLLHDLLTRGLDANGQLRPPPTVAPELYKDSPLGLIPRKWEVSKVGDEFEIQLGKMLDAKKNIGTVKPYVGNIAIQWDQIDLSEVQYVALTPADMEHFRLRNGDLLVCEGGEVGRAAIWENNIDECYYQKAIHRLRALNDFNPYLMRELLQHWAGSGFIANFVTKTSIAHLTREKLAVIPMQVPPREEQGRIVAALTAQKKIIQETAAELGKLKNQKSGLLDDLLTGRVRVKLAETEAA